MIYRRTQKGMLINRNENYFYVNEAGIKSDPDEKSTIFILYEQADVYRMYKL